MWAFMMGMIFSPAMIIILLIIAVLFDHNEAKGWVVFVALVAAVLAWSVFGATWQQLLIVAGAWIPIGIAWSIWRWRRHCSKVVTKFKESGAVHPDTYTTSKIDPANSKSTIVYWIIAWPISVIEMSIGDLIDVIGVLVTQVFKGTYARISASALRDLENINKQK